MPEPQLISPTATLLRGYVAAQAESARARRAPFDFVGAVTAAQLHIVRQAAKAANYEELWLVCGPVFIGLTQLQSKDGNRLYYEVRPRLQKRGFGEALLRLTLRHLAAVGRCSIEVSVHPDNYASVKLIERAGGTTTHEHDDRGWRGYSIPLR